MHPYPYILTQVAREWVEAFNRHDLEALLALYADEATHSSPKLLARQPKTGGKITGKPDLRAWWSQAFLCLPSLHYELKTIIAGFDGRVVIEYERLADGEETIRIAEVFDVGEDKLISESRVYHG